MLKGWSNVDSSTFELLTRANFELVSSRLRTARDRVYVLDQIITRLRSESRDDDLGPYWITIGFALNESAITRLWSAVIDSGSDSVSLRQFCGALIRDGHSDKRLDAVKARLAEMRKSLDDLNEFQTKIAHSLVTRILTSNLPLSDLKSLSGEAWKVFDELSQIAGHGSWNLKFYDGQRDRAVKQELDRTFGNT